MRRPVVLWFVVVFGVGAALLNLLKTVGVLGLAGKRPASEVVISLLVFLAIIVVSTWVVASLLKKSFRSKTPVSIYLWFMLLIYPLSNMLRALGLFLPGPEYRPEELRGAAAVELIRYVFVIGLIVWVGFSKALKAHLKRLDAAAG